MLGALAAFFGSVAVQRVVFYAIYDNTNPDGDPDGGVAENYVAFLIAAVVFVVIVTAVLVTVLRRLRRGVYEDLPTTS